MCGARAAACWSVMRMREARPARGESSAISLLAPGLLAPASASCTWVTSSPVSSVWRHRLSHNEEGLKYP